MALFQPWPPKNHETSSCLASGYGLKSSIMRFWEPIEVGQNCDKTYDVLGFILSVMSFKRGVQGWQRQKFFEQPNLRNVKWQKRENFTRMMDAREYSAISIAGCSWAVGSSVVKPPHPAPWRLYWSLANATRPAANITCRLSNKGRTNFGSGIWQCRAE